MDNIKTTQSNVFFFDKAIQNGEAIDQNGNKHIVVTNGNEFVITTCDGVEYCFNSDGKQFADFKQLQLVTPSRVKVKVYGYAIYNKKTMTLVDMENSSKAFGIADKDDDLAVINTTNSNSKETLKELGIEQTSWYL